MKVMKKIAILLAFVSLLSSCEDMFAPAPENNLDLEIVKKSPDMAQGLLGYAYAINPFQTRSESDVATDDAVSNDINNTYLVMATGGWTAMNNNPTTQWEARRSVIQYLNIFLNIVSDVVWAKNDTIPIQQIYEDRMSGEAYAMRALNNYYLLRAHGGWTADNELLGIPILTEPEGASSNFNVPRSTYQESVDQIISDLTTAIDLLPLEYVDIAPGDIAKVPQKYRDLGLKNPEDYNRAAGYQFKGRMDGITAKAILAQVTLMAASPAFSEGTTTSWEDAANAAADVLANIGGLAGMDPVGWKWYMNKDQIQPGFVPKELLWTGNATNERAQEEDNFPVSLYGRGRINPSQNLVDAFGMANGYPIRDGGSGYAANDPYANRDPRLSAYIMLNETTYGPNDVMIITGTYGTNNDGIGKDAAVSTRTGYYLRKLLRDDVIANPSYALNQYHYPVRIRYTEIFLAYAEAANEAWGPTNAGSRGYSAYDVIKAIRARAGVGAANGDAYLESIKNDKEKMRNLIQNERRIELCFENKRFWDLRRWNLPLTEAVKGMRIDRNSPLSFTIPPMPTLAAQKFFERMGSPEG